MFGRVAERPNATDCKSVVLRLRWFESIPFHHDGAIRTKIIFHFMFFIYGIILVLQFLLKENLIHFF